MAVYKESDTNTWRVIYRYTDWLGERKQTSKRGFLTKREALAWEREQLNKVQADLDMTFESFVQTYTADMQSRIKENTWETKEHIIRTKLRPYFDKRKICEIQPKEIIAWQNEMINYRDEKGKPYSPVYLKTLHNQLSAIFNHAVKFYGLRNNPAAKVGNMGKAKNKEMLSWTKEEYQKFADAMMDKPISIAFYDALTKPQAIKDFYEHDELVSITKELTDLLRKNRTIDWQKKDSARAGMRRLVKRLLRKHKYPPEGMDDAVLTVMNQCEMWTDNVMVV